MAVVPSAYPPSPTLSLLLIASRFSSPPFSLAVLIASRAASSLLLLLLVLYTKRRPRRDTNGRTDRPTDDWVCRKATLLLDDDSDDCLLFAVWPSSIKPITGRNLVCPPGRPAPSATTAGGDKANGQNRWECGERGGKGIGPERGGGNTRRAFGRERCVFGCPSHHITELVENEVRTAQGRGKSPAMPGIHLWIRGTGTEDSSSRTHFEKNGMEMVVGAGGGRGGGGEGAEHRRQGQPILFQSFGGLFAGTQNCDHSPPGEKKAIGGRTDI
ncbi:hypothetical protein niasHT_029528 [Heterodera trifolii]|uniref:Uncharacterized protein n=1 Tax=Heterodera trifolii TaxID=157864 RepID=A0ABD2JAX4_9BILA